MKNLLILLALASMPAVTNAQVEFLNPPPIAPTFNTGQVAQVVGASAVATFALNLLPGWDKSATNSFGAKELELEASPAWKSATASGSTPYLSIGGNYMFTRNFGVGGDVITFGNGTGASDLDSGHLFAILRKDMGNVAGHLILGGGRQITPAKFDGEFGGGLEYRYSTGIGILVDTRYCYLFGSKGASGTDHEFLTRVGLTLHF